MTISRKKVANKPDGEIVLEKAAKEALVRRQEACWKKENSTSIIRYNEFIKENGCFTEEHRTF